MTLKPLADEGGHPSSLRCSICSNTMHSIQYEAVTLKRISERSIIYETRPHACLVCPICDSPDPDDL